MTITYTSSVRDASPWMRLFLSRILPVVFVVVGGGLGYLGMKQVLRAKASVDWPTVEGRVLASKVESRMSRGESTDTVYEAEVLFEYEVDGTIYKGNRVTYGSFATDNPNRAQETVNRYPEGQVVDVYYLPSDPAESLLEPGATATSAILPVMGAGLLFVGLMMAVLFTVAFKDVDRSKTSAARSSESAVASS